MSSIKCPECGQKVSKSTHNCPNCGNNLSEFMKERNSFKKTLCICITAIFTVSAVSFSVALNVPEMININDSNSTTTRYVNTVNNNIGVNTTHNSGSNYNNYYENNTNAYVYEPKVPNSSKKITTKTPSTKQTTTKITTQSTTSNGITAKAFSTFLDLQNQGITSHTKATNCLSNYIKTSDSAYTTYFYDYVKIAYGAIGDAYEMSLKHEELNPTSDYLKKSYNVLENILTVDHSLIELGNLIGESLGYLEEAFNITKAIYNDILKTQ